MQQSAWIPVVAVALLGESGQVLLQQRRLGSRHGGLWEFPGGKVEAGETPERALRREIREELDVALGPVWPLAFSSDPETDASLRSPYLILLYSCHEWRGEPRCVEGEAIGWFGMEEIARLPMPPLDVPLVSALVRAQRAMR